MHVSSVDALASAASRSGRLQAWCLRHIARPHPPQEFVPQIDGLRFVAIMAVLLYHAQGYVMVKTGAEPGSGGLLQAVLAHGSFGVPLFFALSGYILCRPFLGGRKVSIKRYFTRRFTRLEPPYIISLLLVFLAKVQWGGDAAQLLPHLAASLFYLHNLVYGEQSAINGVAWSLEVEWQFYVLAPLLFLVVARARSRVRQAALLLFVALGGIGYFLFTTGADSRIFLSILRFFGFFLAGVWVAVLDEDHADFGRGSLAFDVVGIAAWLAVLWILLRSDAGMSLLPLLTAVLVLSGIRGRHSRRLLGWWPVYCIGAMCYTIYLYHFFVVSALGRLLQVDASWAGSPAMAIAGFGAAASVAVVLACLVPYLLIERPFMTWRPGTNRLVDAYRELKN